MIASLLDTDLYKFSCSYAYMKLFPNAEGTFEFVDRSGRQWSDEEFKKLKEEIQLLQYVDMNDSQLDWVTKKCFYIPNSYWEWLANSFKFDPKKINAWLDGDRKLWITVTDKMYKVTLYEVPVLSTVAEVMNSKFANMVNLHDTYKNLEEKIKFANENDLKFSEFGTRRRFSYAVQDRVIEILKAKSKTCAGTSNVYLAWKYNMTPIGTYPHEWPMFHAAITGGYIEANYNCMENWMKVYDGYLGTALIDAFTTKVFLKNFSKKLACQFDGVRQDSGDEIEIGEMILARYRELGIDPKKKTIIFSNALDFPKFKKVNDYFKDKVNVAAGIGTNLTCDMKFFDDTPFKAPNIVMKLYKCRMNPSQDWHNAIKISDDKGKEMGNKNDILMAKYQLGMIDHLYES